MKALQVLFVSILFLSVLGAGCDYKFIKPDTGEPVDPEEPISFSEQIEPIWTTQSCTNCHNGSVTFSLEPGNAYQSLTSLNLMDLDNAPNSLIVKVPGTSAPHTNYNYVGNQKALIITWIEQGAEDN
ncbi:hypothetical protein KEM09_06730 [Carboxylicivirga mesophila]|uniref:Cytochrome C Planctomycete-type domain-containing protein n=1 Tax=Carboxylicivirga mesophila TaxID=1166478 RepID=A0ABS5K895_9BACT|nr:hypothetical protein [Carboxylicivirga mesophila]MBS2211087.1 hypothetical protein [Carboxylicivirga mesophila]